MASLGQATVCFLMEQNREEIAGASKKMGERNRAQIKGKGKSWGKEDRERERKKCNENEH